MISMSGNHIIKSCSFKPEMKWRRKRPWPKSENKKKKRNIEDRFFVKMLLIQGLNWKRYQVNPNHRIPCNLRKRIGKRKKYNKCSQKRKSNLSQQMNSWTTISN
jgi:hypothetical protein